ncbi:hypothetical protein CY34DRAFT_110307 [Suillus luteus UH-Slu-Lm8-n1]|uniref:Unplaced genomic scaffold CY34scaffold_634, whole genome shotgun sequence n=1 Tax=Suillus luteus UH-Slu-Lm8-n1 TaxID=930992 RepID=A0A0C9ZY07_9AGAM|nr:hypothetical protein CY34DRAFT_110307 [Suillus luteus UH-Slu-Lm8-n1]
MPPDRPQATLGVDGVQERRLARLAARVSDRKNVVLELDETGKTLCVWHWPPVAHRVNAVMLSKCTTHLGYPSNAMRDVAPTRPDHEKSFFLMGMALGVLQLTPTSC